MTAAHAVTWQHEVRQVTLHGVERDVERLVLHPGYAKPPQALASWDWTLFPALLAWSDDSAGR